MFSGRRWLIVGLLFAAGCAGAHSSSTPSSTRFVPIEPPPVAPILFGNDPEARSAKVVRWAPSPATVIRACRAAQARARFPVLCPTVLPRAILGGRPGDPPPPIRAEPVPGGRQAQVGVDIGYSAPTEAGDPNWKAHMWRNLPCCFLHLDVLRVREIPRQARQRVIAGVRGRIVVAAGGYESGAVSGLMAFGNHVLFYFRRGGLSYLVSLHAPYRDSRPQEYANAATIRRLAVIVRHLRPASQLDAPPPSSRGTTTPTGGVAAIAVAATPTAVWVADAGSIAVFGPHAYDEPRLVRIDPITGRVVARISAGYLRGDVAVGPGAVWAATFETHVGGIVARVDPRTDRVVARIRAGTWPRALAVSGNTVWIADSAPFYRRGALVSLDASTNRVVGKPIPMGTAPSAVAVANGAVWVADAHEDVVRRVDPRRRRTVATIPVGRSPYGMVAAFGSIWVTDADDGTVSRIDPRTDRTVATIRLGGNPYGIAAGRDDVWIANVGSGTIARIDPTTNRAREPFHVGDDPLAIATAPTGLWVTSNTAGAVTHIRSVR